MALILIALPAHGGNVKDECVRSLFRLQEALRSSGINLALSIFKSANIFLSRNFFGSVCLNDARFTHLLFVDADMVFEPSTVMKMMGQNQPFVNCAYPKRSIKAELVTEGLGLCFLQRGVFDRMHAELPLRRDDHHGLEEFGLRGPLYGFFDSIDGKSEDKSFHARWRQIGGEIVTLKSEPIGHIGEYIYRVV